MQVEAIEHIRPMRGGAQSHLLRGDDGHCYVVKFVNNPQHRRVLANEWLASRLAQTLALPAPPAAQIYVPPELVRSSPGLCIRIGGLSVPCASGVQFGSRLPAPAPYAPIYDYLPEPALLRIENIDEFAGMLLFDKWACNTDGRQVIFCRPYPTGALRAYMVDHGFCFNAGEWNFPDSPLRGLYCRTLVYASVIGWQSFRPWLERLEHLNEGALYAAGSEIPKEWYGKREDLEQLLDRLLRRRSRVRELIWVTRNSPRTPFKNWHENGAMACAS